ncbi:MAG TPA: UDPGP type 1 family protein [Clostridia bacterium]|nr:UDPGP type 1 family protein [Clostridia bacterium]
MNDKISKAIKLLEENEQDNILNWIKKVNDNQKEKIAEQVLSFDFGKLKELYNKTKSTPEFEKNKIENIGYTDLSKLNEMEFKKYKTKGEQIIKEGKYAVITMAGGQGTRLGHNGPKGTFEIDSVNGKKYLFEIIIDSLKKANDKYGVIIPWYIMTSEENNKQTVEFLEEHDYFGYSKDNVMFFEQGKAPLLDINGKLMIDESGIIKEASDGNGSIYVSLKKDGILDDMKKRGIEWIFVGGVDNILLRIVDPILTGITIAEGNLISSKSVVKKNPGERVGVFCKSNGKPMVIEYTELPENMANKYDDSGELVYGEVNILSHLYNIQALEDLSNRELPYHIAFKKASYIDDSGNVIKPEEPNSYKFEAFIFDGFAYYDNMSILRVNREEEFAPIKNAEGNDSPKTATELYNSVKS